jgi:transcriptional regulator with XRE-family HTH domain
MVIDIRYQLMPPLSPEEYAALRADIAERGVLIPVEYDEEGNILDGFHRVQICQELGLDWPRVMRPGLTEGQKLEHAWRLNLARRHLSREQKQGIAVRLRQEGWTQERIAQALAISQGTISMWFNEFINANKLAEPNRIEGKDGKQYPPRKVRQPSTPAAGDTEAAMSTELEASRLTDTQLQRVQADDFEADAASLSPINVERVTTSATPLSPMVTDTPHRAIESAQKFLTDGGELPPAPHDQSPHHEAPDHTAGHWLTLLTELYAALHSLDDRQDMIIISPSWSQQTRADYLQQCLYVISKLQGMQQALTICADNAPSRRGEGGDRVLAESVVASINALERQGEDKGDDGRSSAMDAEEHDYGSLPHESIQRHRPLCTADEVSGRREIDKTTAGRPQSSGGETIPAEISMVGGAQEDRHEQNDDAADIGIGTPVAVSTMSHAGTGTDGPVWDHRRGVIARVKALRAEQRSFLDIATILNAEGMATFTGQGRWHPGMLQRLLKA